MRNFYLYLIVFFQIIHCYSSTEEPVNIKGDFGVLEQFIGVKLNISNILDNKEYVINQVKIELVDNGNSLIINYKPKFENKHYIKLIKITNPSKFKVESDLGDFNEVEAIKGKYGAITIIGKYNSKKYDIIGQNLVESTNMFNGNPFFMYEYLLDPKITSKKKLDKQKKDFGELLSPNCEIITEFNGRINKFRLVGLKNTKLKINTTRQITCIITIYDSKGNKIKSVEEYSLETILPSDDLYFITILMDSEEYYNRIEIFAEYE